MSVLEIISDFAVNIAGSIRRVVTSRMCIIPILVLCFSVSALSQDTSESELSELVVIVHVSSETDNITSDELRRIYFGKKTRWENGLRVLPVDHKKGNWIRPVWLSEALQVSDKEYKRMWLRNTFSGRATPPSSFTSTERIIEYVSEHEGAIGYIPYPVDSLPLTTKILLVDSLAGIFGQK